MKNPLLEEDVVVAAMPPKRALWSQIVSGSLTLLAGSGFVGAMNLVYNLYIAGCRCLLSEFARSRIDYSAGTRYRVLHSIGGATRLHSGNLRVQFAGNQPHP